MTNRDERILAHVGLYRLSIRAAIERLFFEDKSCDDVINRLVARDRALTVDRLPNRISYYKLSLAAARARGIQENRAESRGVRTRSLRRSVAVLWFCCMGTVIRHKIERNKLTQLFGRAPGLGIPHCWEQQPSGRAVYRIYTPGPNTPTDEIVRTLRADSEAAIAHEKLAPLIIADRYVFAVLVETPERKTQLEEHLQRAVPVAAPVLVEVVPDLYQLADAIKNYKTKKGLTDASSQK